MHLRFATLVFAVAAALTGPVSAAGLSGMGAAIYGNSFNFKKANLQTAPVTSIKVGKIALTLQNTRLVDLQKAFGGTLQQNGDATWLCYHTDDSNSWFISNALGGHEFVMMVAVEAASSRVPGDCEAANDSFSAPVFNVPTVGASLADLKAEFGAASGSRIAYRADRPGGYADIAQYLGYQMKGGNVAGIGVGETSIPTDH